MKYMIVALALVAGCAFGSDKVTGEQLDAEHMALLVNGKKVAVLNKIQVRDALVNVRAEASKLKRPGAAEIQAKMRAYRDSLEQQYSK